VFGEDHLRYLVSEYTTYHNRFRPHQALGNRPLSGEPPPAVTGPVSAVVCEERLGGLLLHYRRQAACGSGLDEGFEHRLSARHSPVQSDCRARPRAGP
jgi:hypothetical protein